MGETGPRKRAPLIKFSIFYKSLEENRQDIKSCSFKWWYCLSLLLLIKETLYLLYYPTLLGGCVCLFPPLFFLFTFQFWKFYWLTLKFTYSFCLVMLNLPMNLSKAFIVVIFAWKLPLVSLIFLKRSLVSSLSNSVVFLYFFVLITEEGFLISPCYSLELFIQMGIFFLFPLLFTSLPFSALCKASSAILPFCISFSCGWSWSLPPVQCHEPLLIVLQVLYQI